MRTSAYSWLGALGALTVELVASPGSAACPATSSEVVLDGTELALGFNGKAPATDQRILVIPVVDKNYAYDPANRKFAGSTFQAQLTTIQNEYAAVAQYWLEASYGNVQIASVIPSCFYQTKSSFPTTGQQPFRRASLTSTVLHGYDPLSYTSFTLKYVADPADGEKTITFTGDPTVVFEEPEELVADLKAQLGTAADELEIALLGPPATATFTSRLVFQIVEKRTFLGSKVTVDVGASDGNSRNALGLTQPTVSQSGSVVTVTSDGADLPTAAPPEAGTNLLFSFSEPDNEDVSWLFSGPQTCGSSPACSSWSDAASLFSVLKPSAGASAGSIANTTVNGRNELLYNMNVPAGETYSKVAINDSTSTVVKLLDPTMVERLGLAEAKSQTGTGSFDVPFGAEFLTRDGLESFLTQEFGGPDIGCLSPELANAPGDLKLAADTYLQQFSAIHVYLLSAAETERDNAGYATLCSDVAMGATTTTYTVRAPIALVEVSSLAPTIAHETGHNIGFPDLYNNSNTLSTTIPSDYHPDLTFPGGWDVMADHSLLPHPSSFTKQFRYGWVNDSAGGGTTNNGSVFTVMPDTAQDIILTPLERPAAIYDNLLTPGAMPIAKMIVLPFGNVTGTTYVPGHFLAIENRQKGLTYSQNLPGTQPGLGAFAAGGLRVSDNISDLSVNGSYIKPIARNYSQSLVEPPYPDNGGANIQVGDSLDTTVTFPSYPGITIQAIGTAAGPGTDPSTQPPSYIVHVEYDSSDTFDLGIQPWRAPDQYASNAIWFEPATTETPPASPLAPDQASTDPAAVGNVNPPVWFDGYMNAVPLNWIHVRVTNTGTLNAENVRVKGTYNSPGGAGDAANWKPILPDAYSDTKSIAAGGFADFSIPWNPDSSIASDGHTCVAVEVVDWTVPGLGHVADINPFNNVSQENIFSMTMKSGSPWHDVPFSFNVTNSYDHEIPVVVEPVGLRPGYRLHLDGSTAVLASGESRVFEGTFGWDPAVIPTPPNQNPADPYWQACSPQNPGDPVETTYFAEDLFASTGYPPEVGGWVLDEAGFLAGDHDFAAGTTTITVTAAGQQAAGVWPHMRVSVDGKQIGEASVNSGYLLEYPFTFTATPGTKQIRVTFDNHFASEVENRALLVDTIRVETLVRPAQCGGVWGLSAYALLGDYRVPLGGSSFVAVGKPVGTLTTTTTVNNTTGDITVTGTVNPPAGNQPVRIYVKYPSGRVDILTVPTNSGGGISVTFPPRERGPVTVSTELPEGGPFAPTDRTETPVDACVPAAVVPTCSDGIKNQGETGVDCGGPCPACAPACTAATAVDLGAPGTNKTVPINGCVRVQSGYPSWWGTRPMRLETAGSGHYPVPFTWSNTCSGSSGSGTFTADFQSKTLTTTNKACVTLIDLQGSGTANVTLRYWGG